MTQRLIFLQKCKQLTNCCYSTVVQVEELLIQHQLTYTLVQVERYTALKQLLLWINKLGRTPWQIGILGLTKPLSGQSELRIEQSRAATLFKQQREVSAGGGGVTSGCWDPNSFSWLPDNSTRASPDASAWEHSTAQGTRQPNGQKMIWDCFADQLNASATFSTERSSYFNLRWFHFNMADIWWVSHNGAARRCFSWINVLKKKKHLLRMFSCNNLNNLHLWYIHIDVHFVLKNWLKKKQKNTMKSL